MGETVAWVVIAVVATAAITSWWWRGSASTASPPPPPSSDDLVHLRQEVARLLPALEARLTAIERRPPFDPSPIVGRLAAIEGALADLRKARPAEAAPPVDLGPILTAIAALGPASEKGNLLPGPVDGPPDDLSKVRGIGPKLVGQLARIGVFYYRQIAEWGPDEVARVDRMLEGARGRIDRDGWVAQCRELVGYRGE